MEIELYGSWLFLSKNKQATGLISEKLRKNDLLAGMRRYDIQLYSIVVTAVKSMEIEVDRNLNDRNPVQTFRIEYWNRIL